MDYFGLGYSQLISSIALIGGFLGGGVFFFCNQLIRKDAGSNWRVFSFIGLCGFLIFFFTILCFLNTNGTILVEYSKTLPVSSQVTINMTCSDRMNCTAEIPSQLQISYQQCSCPQQASCLNVTPIPTVTKPETQCKCPPMLTLPKM
jgi:hypothetical protein